jgi:hypothetical protein
MTTEPKTFENLTNELFDAAVEQRRATQQTRELELRVLDKIVEIVHPVLIFMASKIEAKRTFKGDVSFHPVEAFPVVGNRLREARVWLTIHGKWCRVIRRPIFDHGAGIGLLNYRVSAMAQEVGYEQTIEELNPIEVLKSPGVEEVATLLSREMERQIKLRRVAVEDMHTRAGKMKAMEAALAAFAA